MKWLWTAGCQTRDAVAAKERSPMVEQHVERTTSELVIADHKCRRDLTSAIQRHWHPMFNIHHLCSAHAVTLIISDTMLLAFTCADGTDRWYSGTGCLCLLHSESNTVHRMTTSPLVWKWFGCKGQSQGYMARKCPSLKLPNALRHLINIC